MADRAIFVAGFNAGNWDGYFTPDDADKAFEEWSSETPHPRALVAISDDRQWLVVLEPERWSGFGIWRREWSAGTMFATCGYWHWVKQDHAEDTGQDAHEVLVAWLEGREG